MPVDIQHHQPNAQKSWGDPINVGMKTQETTGPKTWYAHDDDNIPLGSDNA